MLINEFNVIINRKGSIRILYVNIYKTTISISIKITSDVVEVAIKNGAKEIAKQNETAPTFMVSIAISIQVASIQGQGNTVLYNFVSKDLLSKHN